ncbi:MAG: photosynthetic reaction center subunit H [Rhodothalassiaceae bacterium]
MDLIGDITGYIDVAQVVLYVFWVFFAGLIFYLRREDRREGYPLESDDGKREYLGAVWGVNEKVFKAEHGTKKELATNRRDSRELNIKKLYPWEGSPWEPMGDPMADGVGPASYAERMNEPDYNSQGLPKIRPLRTAKDYAPAKEDNDPRGMPVFGCDGKQAGTISDIWIDTDEALIRYLEVKLPDEDGTVLLPQTFARISGPNNLLSRLSGIAPMKPGVFVDAITAEMFKTVPRTSRKTQVTLLEEDKITGYYGGGKMFAKPERRGPWL